MGSSVRLGVGRPERYLSEGRWVGDAGGATVLGLQLSGG